MAAAPETGHGWGVFPAALPDRSGAATVRLERNGWHALVAFTAGPYRAVAVEARSVSVVTVVRETSAGAPAGGPASAHRREEPPDAGTEEGIHTDMADYLARAGVPAPPRRTEWLVRLPPGLDEVTFWERLNEAVAPALDAVAGTTDGPHGGTNDATPLAALRRPLAFELDRLLGDAR